METIVAGIDGSDCSRAALRFALAEARLRKARVLAVHAWSIPPVSTYHQAAHVLDTELEALRRAANELLEAVVAEAAVEHSDVEVVKAVVEGHAPDALIAAAEDAALLVVGSRGLGGLKSILLGSVSQECAQRAACPLVIVREPPAGPE